MKSAPKKSKSVAGKKSASKASRRVAAKAVKGPQFDRVVFHGVGHVVKVGKERVLRIYRSADEAVRGGVDPKLARAQFGSALMAGCSIDFGVVFGVSCDDTSCSGGGGTTSCYLQYWDTATRSWKDYGGSSAAVAGSRTWRCTCK